MVLWCGDRNVAIQRSVRAVFIANENCPGDLHGNSTGCPLSMTEIPILCELSAKIPNRALPAR